MDKGTGDARQGGAGVITRDSLRDIAETKLKDLNANSVEQAMSIIEGTARSMGISIEGD